MLASFTTTVPFEHTDPFSSCWCRTRRRPQPTHLEPCHGHSPSALEHHRLHNPGIPVRASDGIHPVTDLVYADDIISLSVSHFPQKDVDFLQLLDDDAPTIVRTPFALSFWKKSKYAGFLHYYRAFRTHGSFFLVLVSDKATSPAHTFGTLSWTFSFGT